MSSTIEFGASAAESARDRRAPWIEGAALALVALLVLVFGGDAVRASYHGYLHTTVGESVLREGLTPENPYHAGAPLRYYTLYPALGVLLGRSGIGSLWGFAVLNVLAAFLLAPALDALGRSAGMSFVARRAAFLAAVLGFNGLGWIGFLFAPQVALGDPPVYALMPSCFAGHAFGWDARLQAFLPKFLNVSSFALALPFALWALAGALRGTRAFVSGIALGVSLALNPLAGGLAAGCALVWLAPRLREPALLRRWIVGGIAGALIALPFLLPALWRAPIGPSLTGKPDLGGSPLANLIGPIVLLAPLAILGARSLAMHVRWRLGFAFLVCAALVLIGEMPQGNEYKMERLAALVLALPAGAWVARLWAANARARLSLASIGLACVPTSALAVAAYLAWGRSAPALPLAVEAGRLHVEPASSAELSNASFELERTLARDAVIVMAHEQDGSRVTSGLVQGNALAPLLSHPLFVDLPQIHNEHQPDLELRLDLVAGLWHGETFVPRSGSARERDAALRELRSVLPERPLLFLVPPSDADVALVLKRAGAQRQGDSSWILLAPLASAAQEER